MGVSVCPTCGGTGCPANAYYAGPNVYFAAGPEEWIALPWTRHHGQCTFCWGYGLVPM